MKKLLLAALISLLAASPAFAARRMAAASGNIGTAATWNTVDTTGTNAFLNSEAANTLLTATPVASSTFTPAAETLVAVGVKMASIAAVASQTGTITIKLANSTSPGTRECTKTVNISDLVSVASATTAEGGWIIVTCAASPNGTDAYTMTCSTSSTNQVNLFSLATTNWDRLLVTNATGAAAAGDQLMVFGQLTAAGTHNAFTVTNNTTSLVNYGAVANVAVDPSISIGQWGTLAFATTASTAFVAEHAGFLVCYSGGTFNAGTSGTRMPLSSSLTYTLNSTVENDTGLDIRNGCTLNAYGDNSRTTTKTTLAATVNAAGTSLTTATSTGWLNGDSIAIAATTIAVPPNEFSDLSTLSGNASGTTVTLAAGVTNAHLGTTYVHTGTNGIAYTMPMQADVALLNHNVKFQGSGATTNGFINIQPNAIVNMDWIELFRMSGTGNFAGIYADTGPGGTFNFTNSSIHDSQDTCIWLGPTNSNFGGTAGAYVTLQHLVVYNCANTTSAVYALQISGAALYPNYSANPYWKVDDVSFIHVGYNSGCCSQRSIWLRTQSGQFSNISISGSGSSNGNGSAFILETNYNTKSQLGGTIGNTWGPIRTYGNIGYTFATSGSQCISGTIQGWYTWHEQGRWSPNMVCGNMTIDPFYLISSAFGIYLPGTGGTTLTLRNGTLGFDSSMGANVPVTYDAANNTVYMDNMELCPSGTISTITFVVCAKVIGQLNDLAPSGGWNASDAKTYLRNTSVLNSLGTSYPTQVGQEGFYGTGAFVVQDCLGCTTPAIKHNAWLPGGFISYDTAITHTSGYSERLTPRILTVSGSITGTTLTLTSGTPSTPLADMLTSDSGSFVPGTVITAGSGTSYTVSQSQTTGAAHFQSYNNQSGSLLRLQSAPLGQGSKIAVSSGTVANVCVWLRPSVSTDGASPWGSSAVTYNGDQPRLINRANPIMGVVSDTVLATASLSAGTWAQLCANLPSAPADGTWEVVVDADQTFTSNAGGSVNVTEWSCTTCQNSNNLQFWFNGSPNEVVAAPSAGGGGGGGHIIGG